MTSPGQLLKPRPYQATAIDAVPAAWARGVRRPAVVWATGLGKTFLFAHVTARYIAEHSRRVLILVHRDELARQAVAELHDVAPHLHVGVVKADENETDAQVIVGSVQTLLNPVRRSQIENVGVVIVDECHHATARSYLDILDHFGCFESDPGRGALALGVTATMARADGIALGQVWQEIVDERDILWGIRHGYLVDVRGITVRVDDMDMSAVRSTAGDYRAADLGQAMEDSSAPQVVAKAYAEHASDRQGIVFTPTVTTAHLMADVMSSSGIDARAVDGDTPPDERREMMKAYGRGEFQVFTNCDVLTEGTNLPTCSCIVMARPTRSAPAYVQRAGRGTRLDRNNPGKNLLIIDAVGVSARHSLVGISSLAGVALSGDETLTEARDRLDAELLAEEVDAQRPERVIERVHAEEADLFHGSRFVWNHTRGGIAFVAAGEEYVVLLPEASGAYAVCALPKKRGAGPTSWIQREISELSYAMTWGEEYAESHGDAVLNTRERDWRKRRAKVGARALADKLRIIYPDDIRGGALSDLIDQVFASQRIDPHALPYLRKLGVRP